MNGWIKFNRIEPLGLSRAGVRSASNTASHVPAPGTNLQDDRISFLLVHGTIPRLWRFRIFGERSWSDADSRFRKELKKNFPRAAVDLFPWNGANTHDARLKAGDQLCASLTKAIANNTKRKFVIIAHSHGGNIALYALRKLSGEQRSRVAGLVCLATPFISAVPLNSRNSISELWMSIILGTSIALSCFWFEIRTGAFVLSAAAALVSIIGLVGAGRLMRMQGDQRDEFATSFAGKISAVSPANLPMYAVSASRDEALILLDIISFGPTWLLSLRRKSLDWFKDLLSNTWAAVKPTKEKFYIDRDNYGRILVRTTRNESSGSSEADLIIPVLLVLLPIIIMMFMVWVVWGCLFAGPHVVCRVVALLHRLNIACDSLGSLGLW